MFKNTYWNSNGKHQGLANRLSDLIPASGTCATPKLERFRRASNLYYQFNNNGHMSVDKDNMQSMFGVSGRVAMNRWHNFSAEEQEAAVVKMEAAFDRIIMAAAVETGVVVKPS